MDFDVFGTARALAFACEGVEAFGGIGEDKRDAVP
jgi:hypothetical protein